MKNTAALLLWSLLAVAPDVAGETKGNAPHALDDLRNAPTEVAVQGRRLLLSGTLWRDFMPSMPPAPNGKPLTAIFKVATADGKKFPAGLRADRAWVIFGEQLWEPARLEEQDAADPSYKDKRGAYANRPDSPAYSLVARGGPKWGPGVAVDIAVRLTDKEGQHYLLRAAKQGIGKVN